MKQRILMTGLNGTVAPFIKAKLELSGFDILPWHRDIVPPEDRVACSEFLDQVEAEAVFHIGMGPEGWAEQMAEWCKQHCKPFVFTSTASVYASTTAGPFTVEDQPDSTEDYGTYKQRCEELITEVNPGALIVRLGWQIGKAPGNNNMVDYFSKQASGRQLKLSRNWFPACSFLEDTADVVIKLFTEGRQGLFLLDGNPGLNHYEIGMKINEILDHPWDIEPVDEPVMNSLMRDARVQVRSIVSHFES